MAPFFVAGIEEWAMQGKSIFHHGGDYAFFPARLKLINFSICEGVCFSLFDFLTYCLTF